MFSLSQDSVRVLDLYVEAGLAMKHEWPVLPEGISEQLMLYGQLVTYHDCLLWNAKVNVCK